MPTKKVIIDAKQAETFKTECFAGKHRVIVDQPLPGGGTDEGPTPLDYQLVALGSCITAIELAG